jgi:hypothetical protein
MLGRDVARAGAWRTRDARSAPCAGRRLRVRGARVMMMFTRNDCGLRMMMMRVTMVTRTRTSTRRETYV